MNNAELYQSSNVLQKQDTHFFLKKYASKINWKKSNKILDVGSGDGSVTTILKSYIPTGCENKVTGIDISEQMVRYANKHHGDDSTSFTILDITDKMPQDFAVNFDHVFSFFALHWISDQETAFKNIFNVLSHGGNFFSVFAASVSSFDLYLKLQNSRWSSLMADTNKYISPYYYMQEPDKKLRQLMADVGFVDIEVEYTDMRYVYDNMEIGKKAMFAVCPFKAPDEVSEEFMKDYMAAAREVGFMHKPGDGQPETIKVDYQLLVAFARKP